MSLLTSLSCVSCACVWRSPPLTDGPTVSDLVLRVHNIVMGQLSSFAFSMLEFGLPAQETLAFVNSMCCEHELSEDQQQMLVQQVNAAVATASKAAAAVAGAAATGDEGAAL